MPSSMTFGFDCDVNVMFDFIGSEECKKLVPILVVTFLIGVLYEFILSYKTSIYNKLCSEDKNIEICNKLLLCLYYITILLLSQILMFSLMSVSFWIALSLISGCTLGYFLFGINVEVETQDNKVTFEEVPQQTI